jgi:hypothetical protein
VDCGLGLTYCEDGDSLLGKAMLPGGVHGVPCGVLW